VEAEFFLQVAYNVKVFAIGRIFIERPARYKCLIENILLKIRFAA
jgi:hypothetical protein